MINRALILQSFKTVRSNSIEAARDIPAEKFSFKPEGEGTMSLLDLFKTILRSTEFMVGMALRPESKISITPEKPREAWLKETLTTNLDAITTKDQVIAALEASMKSIEARVNAADETFLHSRITTPDNIEKVRLWVVQCAKEQEMVYRGQVYLYERMLGIVPHPARKAAAAAAAKK